MKLIINKRIRNQCLSSLIGIFAVIPGLLAAPQGGVVVGGSGSINNNTANTTTVNQNSQSMVVNWSSFNVNANESVNFVQPSSNAAVLNNIHDQNPSQIYGSINANGRVFLSNPNGMIFGPGSVVNVGALMATSLSISADDFMAGNYSFGASTNSDGAIINQGIIQAATGGSIALIGGSVKNEGVIIANYGHVVLATGRQATINFDGDGLLNFQIDDSVLDNTAGDENAIHNTGSIIADAGQIVLSANASEGIFTNVINNEGLIKATRIENVGGVIHLSGGPGRVISSGDIAATGQNGVGGDVLLLGDQVGLFDNATVDASGSDGGGVVLIGGDFQGNNPDIQNAQQTYIGSDTTIKADAIESGDGGKVIIWADKTTQYYGDISAQGGETSGDGGLVEVSGKQWLDFRGLVTTTANNGSVGTLLLDPTDITISTGVDSIEQDVTNTFQETDDGAGSVSATSILNTTVLTTVLQANDVIVTTTSANVTATDGGKITLANDLNLTMAGEHTLTLQAETDIELNAAITATSNSLNLVLNAADNVTINGDIDTNGGDFTSSGSANFTTGDGNTITTGGGNIGINHSGAVLIQADVSTIGGAGGNFVSSGTTFTTTNNDNIATGGGNVDINHSGAVLIQASVDTLGGNFESAGTTFTTTNSDTISTGGGNVDIDHSAAVLIQADVFTLGGNFASVGTTFTTNNDDSITTNNGANNSSGTISIQHTDNISLGDSITSGFNTVLVDTTLGSITTDEAGDVVTGTSVTLNAEDGIGTGTDASAISTATTALTFNNSGTPTGGVFIRNDSAAGTVTVMGSNSTAGGAVNIAETNGAVTITAGGVTGTGASAVTIAATQEILLNDAVSGDVVVIDSADGSITGLGEITGTTSVRLDAEDGIGTGTGASAISTVTSALAFNNSGALPTGGVFIRNDSGGGTVTVTDSNNTAGGAVNIVETTGDLSIASGSISSGGTLDISVLKDEGIFTIAGTGSTSGTAGAHTYTADNMAIGSGIGAGAQTVTLLTNTAADTIDLGLAGAAAGQLELSDAELDLITASTLEIGNASQGAITVSAAISPALSTNLTLNSLDNITLNDAVSGGAVVIDSATGSITGAGLVTGATSVTLNAEDGIGTGIGASAISTATTALTFDNSGTPTGGVFIRNDSAAGTVTVMGSNSAAGGAVNIAETNGAVTITAGGVTGTGASAVTIAATQGMLLNGAVSGDVVVIKSDAGSITSTGLVTGTTSVTLNAEDGIGTGTGASAISTATSALAFNNSGALPTGGVFIRNDSGGGTVTIAGSNTANGEAIDIAETDGAVTITTGGVTGTSAVTIAATQEILLNDAVSGDVVVIDSDAGSITGIGLVTGTTSVALNASTGIGTATALSTVANTLAFNNSSSGLVNISNTVGTGNTVLVNGDNVGTDLTSVTETTGGLSVTAGDVTGGGDITILAEENLLLDNDVTGVGTVTVDSAVGAITATAAVDVVTGDSVILNAATGIGTTTALSTAANTLAFNNLTTTGVVSISNTVGAGNTVSISGDNASFVTNITETTGGLSVTGSAVTSADVIRIVAQENILLNNDVTSVGNGTIEITSLFGSITAGAVGDVVTGSTVTLQAVNGIGSAIALSTVADALSFSNSTTGLVNISNTKTGEVTVNGINDGTGATSITETLGDISVNNLTAGGDINVSVLADDQILTTFGITGTNGAHSYTADEFNVVGTLDATGQTVTIKSATMGDAIDLGSMTDLAANTLELSSVELGQIRASTLIIGESGQSGAITISADVTPTNVDTLHLISTDSVTATVGGILGDKNLAIEAGGAVNFTDANTEVATLAISAPGQSVTLNNAADLMVGTVDGVDGISGSAVVLGSTLGSITGPGLITGTTSVTLNAASGIGANGVSLSTATDTLSFNNSTNGFVNIVNTVGAGNTVSVNGNNAGTDFTGITESTGNIVISDVISGAGVVIIDSTEGSITALAADDIVMGTTLMLDADDGIGSNTQSIFTVADTIQFNNSATTTGDVYISNAQATGVSISGTNGGTGGISVANTTGDITLAGLVSTGSGLIALNSFGALDIANNITTTGDLDLDADSMSGAGVISGNLLTADASTIIDLNTAVTSVDLSVVDVVGPSSITVSNSGALTLAAVDTNNGDITVVSTGLLTASSVSGGGNSDISLTGAGIDLGAVVTRLNGFNSVTLDAGGGDITDGNGNTSNITTSDLIITNAGNVGLGDAIETIIFNELNFNINGALELINTPTFFSPTTVLLEVTGTTTGGDVSIEQSGSNGGNVFLNIESLNSNGGAINLTADDIAANLGGVVSVGAINSGAGLITLDSSTPAADIQLGGFNGFGSSVFDGIASSGGLTIGSTSHAGSFTVVGAIDTTTVTAGTFSLLTDANIIINDSITGAIPIILQANTGSISGAGTVTGASVSAIAGGSLTLGSVVANTGDINLQATNGSVTTNGTVRSTMGSITAISSDASVQINGLLSAAGDVDVQAVNENIAFGAGAGITSTAGGISLISSGDITGAGNLNLTAVTGLLMNNPLVIAGNIDLNIDTLNVQQDITSTNGGNISFVSGNLSFDQDRIISSSGLLTLPVAVANGDLSLLSVGDMTILGIDISNGDLLLNAGSGLLDIQGNITSTDNISMLAGDLNINNAAATVVATGTVTISDQATGAGIGLGAFQTGKLNLSTNELLTITSAGINLQSNNGIELQGDLNATAMAVPLTIIANEFSTIGVSTIALGGDLNFVDTTVTVPGAFNIDIDGAFAMNGAMSTTGAVSIDAGMGITMGSPSSITTTNDAITLISGANNISLGLLDAGAAAVSITATGGDILNNNGVFTDVTRSLTNVRAGSVTLVATNRIGISSSDAITLDIDPNNSINLTFGADNAYVNNLQNTPIVNNSAGEVVVGLIFSSGIIGIGQNIGSDSDDNENQLNEDEYANLLSDDLFISVLGADFKNLFGEDDEDEVVSTLIPSVPVLVKNVDGWEFVAPSRRQSLEKLRKNQEQGVKYIDWL